MIENEDGDIKCELWSLYLAIRIFSDGCILASDGRGEINPAGIRYYNELIDALLQKGTQYTRQADNACIYEKDCWIKFNSSCLFA